MKIAILSRKKSYYSTRRLVEAAEQAGHEAQVIDTLRVYMDIASHRPGIHYNGEALTGFDAVIPRIGASITFYGTAVLRQFEMMGVYSVNESVAITRSRDKLRASQLLSRKGIGLPVTGFANSPGDTDDLLELVGGAPVVIKLLEGTQGVGVVLAETKKAAESVIEAFRGLKANFMVQEFIKEAGGADLRCFVIGDRVVASMMRRGAEGDFRSNLHRGGNAEPVRITPEERSTAVRADSASTASGWWTVSSTCSSTSTAASSRSSRSRLPSWPRSTPTSPPTWRVGSRCCRSSRIWPMRSGTIGRVSAWPRYDNGPGNASAAK